MKRPKGKIKRVKRSGGFGRGLRGGLRLLSKGKNCIMKKNISRSIDPAHRKMNTMVPFMIWTVAQKNTRNRLIL